MYTINKINGLDMAATVESIQETRSSGEVRSVEEDGTFSGYITVWDTVDDYNSRFMRGSFKKTIQERGSKVKVLYNHDTLIGKVTEVREDDHGVFASGQLNLEVAEARAAHAFMKDGTLEGLSFMFRTIKEGFAAGVREIKEVQLFELGPVIFPANDAALITDVRSTDFDTTLEETQLEEEGWTLQSALRWTLSEVWWDNNTTPDNVMGLLDKAMSDHHAAYLDYAARWVALFWSNNNVRSTPFSNNLSTAFAALLEQRSETVEQLATNTAITLDEAKQLRQGEVITNRDKLKELSAELDTAHRSTRNKAVEALCLELRDGLTDSEKTRVAALLTHNEKRSEPEPSIFADTLDFYKNHNGE